MALTPCPACSREIAATALACPHCGAATEHQQRIARAALSGARMQFAFGLFWVGLLLYVGYCAAVGGR